MDSYTVFPLLLVLLAGEFQIDTSIAESFVQLRNNVPLRKAARNLATSPDLGFFLPCSEKVHKCTSPWTATHKVSSSVLSFFDGNMRVIAQSVRSYHFVTRFLPIYIWDNLFTYVYEHFQMRWIMLHSSIKMFRTRVYARLNVYHTHEYYCESELILRIFDCKGAPVRFSIQHPVGSL